MSLEHALTLLALFSVATGLILAVTLIVMSHLAKRAGDEIEKEMNRRRLRI